MSKNIDNRRHTLLRDELNHLRQQRDAHQMDEPEYIDKVLALIFQTIECIWPAYRSTEIKGVVEGMGFVPSYQVNEVTAQANAGYNRGLSDTHAIIDNILKGEE